MPVVYAHDGQNLVSYGHSYGGEPWRLDTAATALRRSGGPALIIVGIWNTAARMTDYMPPVTDGASFAAEHGDLPHGDRYADYIVDAVKSMVDANFPTIGTRDGTFILGSSMGGLASLYTLGRHPEVFAGAVCMSTHWPVGGVPLVDALADALPGPGRHRLWFDRGTEGLDAQYGPLQDRFDDRLARSGWRYGHDVSSTVYEGADHHEVAWRARALDALRFVTGGAN